MKKLQVLMLTLLLALTASGGWAGGLPGYYPTTFARMGNINHLDIRTAAIVIDDMPYRIDANVPVHTLRTQFATVSDLAAGMHIAYNISPAAAGYPQISEVWVLPRKYHSTSRMRGR